MIFPLLYGYPAVLVPSSSRPELLHVLEPLSFDEREAFRLPRVRQRAVLNRVEHELLQQPQVRRLARHAHERCKRERNPSKLSLKAVVQLRGFLEASIRYF